MYGRVGSRKREPVVRSQLLGVKDVSFINVLAYANFGEPGDGLVSIASMWDDSAP